MSELALFKAVETDWSNKPRGNHHTGGYCFDIKLVRATLKPSSANRVHEWGAPCVEFTKVSGRWAHCERSNHTKGKEGSQGWLVNGSGRQNVNVKD